MCCVRGDGLKIKPLIVYKSQGKKKMDTIDTVSSKESIIAYSASGWVNQVILSKYIHFLFPMMSKGLLIWDCASQHTSPDITSYVAKKEIFVEFVPPGCTGFIQVADVELIMPMKDYIKGKYKDYYKDQMENMLELKNNPEFVMPKQPPKRGRKSTKTTMSYHKPPVATSRQWIVEGWNQVSPETVP